VCWGWGRRRKCRPRHAAFEHQDEEGDCRNISERHTLPEGGPGHCGVAEGIGRDITCRDPNEDRQSDTTGPRGVASGAHPVS